MTTTIHTLRASSVEALERLYRDAPVAPAPRGRFRGEVLHRVSTRFARSAPITAMLVPWERLPFGIDFATRTWFFVDPRVRLGRFRLEPGRSRWRDADTLRMRYDVSRLPIRGLLYDEVKPLDETLCLGLGGINFERGRGDLFFFALEAVAEASPVRRKPH
ncbi:MAG TPA: hypothetical protein VLM85_20385 [Polyangiaceae bacterium]|nr:hypothetical protein [Polyangiaceae bacterium]